jgi:hypothetical protein
MIDRRCRRDNKPGIPGQERVDRGRRAVPARILCPVLDEIRDDDIGSRPYYERNGLLLWSARTLLMESPCRMDRQEIVQPLR